LTSEVAEMSLGEAANQFLASLETEEKAASQPDIDRFVRWFGSQRAITGLNAAEIENYAERLSQSDRDYSRKLETVKAFLATARKSKWTKTNLGTNLKIRKSKSKTKGSLSKANAAAEPVVLTQEGHDKIVSELAGLKERRLQVIEDMRRAAADKDFRENAPLHAAREEKGHIEGRILELEETLKVAQIMDDHAQKSVHIAIGHTIVISEIGTGEEMRYTLVNAREVDLSKGRISCVSPIGQAVLGKVEGATCEVVAPVGKLRYRIKKVE
jgi:transcription elongation factor GreA